MDHAIRGAGLDRRLAQLVLGRLVERVDPLAAFLYIPVDHIPEIQQLQYDVLDGFDSDAVQLEPVEPENLHITLLYIDRVKDEDLEEFFNRLSLVMPVAFTLEVSHSGTFPEAEDKPVVLHLAPSPSLVRLQSELYNTAFSMGLPLSIFSKPESFKPHISLALELQPPDARIPDIQAPVRIPIERFVVSRPDYERVRTIHLPKVRNADVLVEQAEGQLPPATPTTIGGSIPSGATTPEEDKRQMDEAVKRPLGRQKPLHLRILYDPNLHKEAQSVTTFDTFDITLGPGYYGAGPEERGGILARAIGLDLARRLLLGPGGAHEWQRADAMMAAPAKEVEAGYRYVFANNSLVEAVADTYAVLSLNPGEIGERGYWNASDWVGIAVSEQPQFAPAELPDLHELVKRIGEEPVFPGVTLVVEDASTETQTTLEDMQDDDEEEAMASGTAGGEYAVSKSDLLYLLRGGSLTYGPLRRTLMLSDGPFVLIEDGKPVERLLPPEPSEFAAPEREAEPVSIPERGLRERVTAVLRGFVKSVADLLGRGGEGSGHFEHDGRPGEVGGSKPGKKGGITVGEREARRKEREQREAEAAAKRERFDQQRAETLADARAKIESGEENPLTTARDEYARFPGLEEGFDRDTPEGDRLWLEYFVRKKLWNVVVARAVATGEITPEEADELGLTEGPTRGAEAWKPLPERLWHVTTAATAVQQEGLKTRAELSDQSGNGLGGGTDMAISFTDRPEVAEFIYHALIEGRQVATGQITIPDFIDEAREGGGGADQPFLEDWMQYHSRDWKDGDAIPQGIQDVIDGIDRDRIGRGRTLEEQIAEKGPGWRPADDGRSWEGGDGQTYYNQFLRDLSDDERIDRSFDIWKTFSTYRQHAGGYEDPLFFGSDAGALAEIETDEIQILEFSGENGLGWQESALGEWRTSSGDAVSFAAVLEPTGHRLTRSEIRARFGQAKEESMIVRQAGARGLKPPRRSMFFTSGASGPGLDDEQGIIKAIMKAPEILPEGIEVHVAEGIRKGAWSRLGSNMVLLSAGPGKATASIPVVKFFKPVENPNAVTLISVAFLRRQDEDIRALDDELEALRERGGEGSGHFGHEGRPGEVGGSKPSTGPTAEDELGDIRFPRDNEILDELRARVREIQSEGKFAVLTQDAETDEWLIITDRERAIADAGEKNRFANRETLYAYTPVEMIFQKGGDSHSVEIDSLELSDLRAFAELSHEMGGTFVLSHNHPDHPEAEGIYMPPSPSDIQAAILTNADEMRVYSGDGDYIVRIARWGRASASELATVMREFDEAEAPRRFPEEMLAGSREQEQNYILNEGLTKEVRQFQLERLDHVVETLDWISYEFRSLED